MSKYLLLLFFLGSYFPLVAQTEQAKLLVQSPDGKTVKLLWMIKDPVKNIAGFDIKRKEGLDTWRKLNSAPVMPGISAKKDLLIADADKHEESAVKAKLYKLLAAHKLQETENNELLHKPGNDDHEWYNIGEMNTRDYDVALMSGFAYVDHTVTKKTDYQYGLYAAGTDDLLARATWNYGEIPDLNAVKEITSKSKGKNNGILVMWVADTVKMRAASIAGFNIYRQGIRLNATPIQPAGNGDLATFAWYDKSASSDMAVQYSISAESIFGIEGIIKSYTYNPADHPQQYKKAEVTDIASPGYYFKDGIVVKWSFPKDYERFLKGFYIEKNNFPEGYKRVSALLDPSMHEFVDKSTSPVSGYISFRAVAVYNDKSEIAGAERIYTYLQVREPPQPQQLRYNLVQTERKATAYLAWDGPMAGDTVTDYYRLYAIEPGDNQWRVIGDPVISNSFTFIVQRGSAAVYKFCVSAVGKNKTEGAMSDTLSIPMPSLDLPQPAPADVSADSSTAIIRWSYPEINDLKGFRIYENNNLIASEHDADKNSRQFVAHGLVPGTAYEFKIMAVGDRGVVSEYSAPRTLIAAKMPGK